jgi:hypothetical protein
MLRSAFAAIALLGLALPAFGNTAYSFETANPVEQRRVIAESVVWTCEGTTCTAQLDRKRPTVRICRQIVRQVGEVTALRNSNTELSAEELAQCNASARR